MEFYLLKDIRWPARGQSSQPLNVSMAIARFNKNRISVEHHTNRTFL